MDLPHYDVMRRSLVFIWLRIYDHRPPTSIRAFSKILAEAKTQASITAMMPAAYMALAPAAKLAVATYTGIAS